MAGLIRVYYNYKLIISYLQLPPVPSGLLEQPLKNPSIKSELEEYLEMQSVNPGQRARCSSDPSMLAQRYHLDERDAEGLRKMVPLLVGEGEKKSDLLDGQRVSIDNIYDFIAS